MVTDPSPDLEDLKDAIKNKVRLFVMYDNKSLIIDPYAIGYDKNRKKWLFCEQHLDLQNQNQIPKWCLLCWEKISRTHPLGDISDHPSNKVPFVVTRGFKESNEFKIIKEFIICCVEGPCE